MKRFIFFVGILVSFNSYVLAMEKQKPTQVVPFEVSESTPVKEGKCWTESLAAPRKGAWRCMIENRIYDPCFSTSSSEIVICDMDPASHKTGFAMKLTEPLPKSSTLHVKESQPFQIRLVDDTVCAPFTGTRMALGKEIVIYGCKHTDCSTRAACEIGILSIDRRKPTWIAKVVTYTLSKKGKLEVKMLKQIPVDTVWE